MRKINVLYLITTLRPYGGAEVALSNLLPYMDNAVYKIWVGTVFSREENQVSICLPDGQVEYFNFKKRYYLDLSGYLKLFRFIKTNNIDIIHTHLFAANTVGRIAGWLSRVKVIISTEHNTYLKRKPFLNIVDFFLSLITTKIIAVSNTVSQFYSSKTKINSRKIITIHNCVPIDKIKEISEVEKNEKRASLGINKDEMLVFSVGRLTEQKGFDYLIDTISILLKENKKIRLIIAGTGHLQQHLQYKIDMLGVSKFVQLIGFRKDIFELMQISDVLAMSSLWEGLPVTLIEAGACKLPVIATAVGGIMEVIRDGENGIIVPIGDRAALAKGLTCLLSSKEKLTAMGERARKLIEQNFSGPAVAYKLENLYRKLLAENT